MCGRSFTNTSSPKMRFSHEPGSRDRRRRFLIGNSRHILNRATCPLHLVTKGASACAGLAALSGAGLEAFSVRRGSAEAIDPTMGLDWLAPEPPLARILACNSSSSVMGWAGNTSLDFGGTSPPVMGIGKRIADFPMAIGPKDALCARTLPIRKARRPTTTVRTKKQRKTASIKL